MGAAQERSCDVHKLGVEARAVDAVGELRTNGEYAVSEEERAHFLEHGYVHLRGLLTDLEVATLEVDYDRFLRREIDVPGNDFCDMAGDYGRTPDDYSIVNVMLPRRY